jgi:MFS family permease
MNQRQPEKNDRDFFRVVQWASALGMGSMAAFLYSLKQVHPHIRLEVGVGTAVSFLGAAIFSWLFCGRLARTGTTDEAGGAGAGDGRRRRFLVRWLIFFLSICALGTIAAFGYALKDVSSGSRREVIEGTGIACLVLAAGGWLIRKAFRFFEEHSEAELESLREEEQED